MRMCDLRIQSMHDYKNRGGVRTVRAHCSDDEIRITCIVRCPSRTLKK